MDYSFLVWKTLSEKKLADHRILTVSEMVRESTEGRSGRFVVLDAPDWAIVVPTLVEDGHEYFLMVRQYRHGSDALSLEFPGGVIEPGEDPVHAALRELQEETGYAASTMMLASSMSPNPAIMRNTQHVFLARGLHRNGGQELDEHEQINVEKVRVEEVLAGFGRPPYIHALMMAALFCWQREHGSGK